MKLTPLVQIVSTYQRINSPRHDNESNQEICESQWDNQPICWSLKTFLPDDAANNLYRSQESMLIKLSISGADPIKLIFLRFLFFGVKLGHFIINYFFLYERNENAYQQKRKKSSLAKKKSFIGSAFGVKYLKIIIKCKLTMVCQVINFWASFNSKSIVSLWLWNSMNSQAFPAYLMVLVYK